MRISFYLVDVFADEPLTGNPLAIVPGADGLDDATLEKIARELQQAETTFLLAPSKQTADWRLRSFTAGGVEVFGAGHNALGAWWWLAESGALPQESGRTVFTQEIGELLLPVEIDYRDQVLQSVVMTQAAPVFGKVLEDASAVASALGLEKGDLGRFSAQAVSTGACHLMVHLRDREAVGRATPDVTRLVKILEDASAEGCYVYSLDPVTLSAMAHARFFNPGVGLFEDSATGTAAGPLAALLVARDFAADGSTIAIEQGYEMARPSVLRVHVSGSSVRLSGRCVTVAKGTLRVR